MVAGIAAAAGRVRRETDVRPVDGVCRLRGKANIKWPEDEVYGEAAGDVSVLVVGGGYVWARRGAGGVVVTFVDVDAALDEVGERFLGGAIGGEFEAADGRAFLRADRRRWDVIVLDAFRHRTAVPVHLVTLEGLSLVRERLAPGGGCK